MNQMDKEEDSTEAVYMAQEDSHIVMSEKVQALAGSIYQEFERMINKYDEDVVKNLMPLVVNVLECLDLSYSENQEHEVELELLREDNEQLVTQYEREKQLRKNSEQKLLELEDNTDEQIKDQSSKIESLEAILRMLELRAKNSTDHVSRLEEKEVEMKKEYTKLHDRYNELFKSHVDYMERTKILMGTDRLENFGTGNFGLQNSMNKKQSVMTRSAGPVSFGFTSFENNSLKTFSSPGDGNSSYYSPNTSSRSDANIHEEMSMDDIDMNHQSSNSPNASQNQSTKEASKSQTKKEERSGNTLYQEFSFQDQDIDPIDVTGSWVNPGDFSSNVDEIYERENSCESPTAHSSLHNGMGKEVENLITENNELLATKNALNIVKDDLIAKVDELTSEQEILREEIISLQSVKSRMKLRIQELEEELKRIKDENEKKLSNKSEDEEDVPLAQRKRFTRVEMARVLMERNQYKERFMELQDAVRWAEMIRATKTEPTFDQKRANNKGILNFFSNLFTTKSPTSGLTTDRLVSSGGMAVHHHSPTKSLNQQQQSNSGIESSINSTSSTSSRPEMPAERSQLNVQLRRLTTQDPHKKDQTYKQILHVRKDDGRLQAYGWSLPATAKPAASNSAAAASVNNKEVKSSNLSQSTGKNLPVPVPIYCRPFMEQLPGMRIFCASGVDLSGGCTKDRELIHNYTSPHTWICTARHSASFVTVIDANRPAEILSNFEICKAHLLCISSVPGAKEDDFAYDEGLVNFSNDDNETKEQTNEDFTLSFINCAEVDQNRRDSINETELKETDEVSKNEPSSSELDESGFKDEEEFQDALSSSPKSEVKMSSVLSTMWLGAQNGSIYIHSALSKWDKCLHSIRLPDSVLAITHVRGRTFASLANGTIAIFRRGKDGQWDLTSYHLLDLGQQPHHSIRCLSAVNHDIWCGFRNKIHVIDVRTLTIKTNFEAHPRKESQVRQMAWYGDGVWVSIRLDSTLRLYHARTYQHLQDVDIEPYVSKMLGTGKLGFSYARITALLLASHRLWIGTGNGVIISVPLSVSEALPNPLHGRGPGSIVRCVSVDESGLEIPYCSMSQAQLSFHGHRDAVKFFVAVFCCSSIQFNDTDQQQDDASNPNPNEPKSNSMLVLSGGDGYLDFRVSADGDDDNLKSPDLEQNQRIDKAHVIVWQVVTS